MLQSESISRWLNERLLRKPFSRPGRDLAQPLARSAARCVDWSKDANAISPVTLIQNRIATDMTALVSVHHSKASQSGDHAQPCPRTNAVTALPFVGGACALKISASSGLSLARKAKTLPGTNRTTYRILPATMPVVLFFQSPRSEEETRQTKCRKGEKATVRADVRQSDVVLSFASFARKYLP